MVREYVIRLPGGRGLPPMPWVNVVANESFGFLASETGAGYTWRGNSRENQLTAWRNDPVIDPHEGALYVRDDEAGTFRSPLPGPVRGTRLARSASRPRLLALATFGCEIDHEVCFVRTRVGSARR